MIGRVGIEDYGFELGQLYSELQELEGDKENYTDVVDAYRQGQISPDRMEKAVYEMAEEFDEFADEVRDAKMVSSKAVDSFGTAGDEVPDDLEWGDEQLGERLVEEGFELLTSFPGTGYEGSATENELAYQSFIEAAEEPDFINDELTRGEQLNQIISFLDQKLEDIREEVREYGGEFLYENLGTTISGAYLDIQDGYVEASMEQEIENRKAEEIRKNPRDIYIGGFESEEGTESLEEARRQVREQVPRGKLPNEGPTEEEVQENSERIENKREQVRNREDRGIQ